MRMVDRICCPAFLRSAAALTFMALTCVACVENKVVVRPDAIEPIRRVAVVSLLGNTFRHTHPGGLLPGDQIFETPVPELSIDAKVTEALTEHLKEDRRFTVVDVSSRLPDLVRVYAPSKDGSSSGEEYDLKRIEADLKAIAATNNIDAFVIVLRRSGQDCMPECTAHVYGYGLYLRIGLDYISVQAYSRTFMTIVRTSDMTSIGERGIDSSESFNVSYWTEGLGKLGKEERLAVFESIERQLKRETVAAMREIGFTR